MIVVTGAAGFIGANLIAALNRRGVADIIAVDAVDARDHPNLAKLSFAEYIDKHSFLTMAQRGLTATSASRSDITAVFHQGACSDTMMLDEDYLRANNLEYSKTLLHFCNAHGAQYLYASSASVYGGGNVFIESPQYESALNGYARSKLQFDEYVRAQFSQQKIQCQCIGLRYFNVYGDYEQHKGRMASVARHFFNQYRAQQCVRLFAGGDGCADGEQRRDFVAVDDIVAVNLHFYDQPKQSGVFNAGSGASYSFNEVALTVINSLRDDAPYTLDQARAVGAIEYIPMPDALRGKYQNYTCADLTQLRAAGYIAPFADVAHGVARYVAQMQAELSEAQPTES